MNEPEIKGHGYRTRLEREREIAGGYGKGTAGGYIVWCWCPDDEMEENITDYDAASSEPKARKLLRSMADTRGWVRHRWDGQMLTAYDSTPIPVWDDEAETWIPTPPIFVEGVPK